MSETDSHSPENDNHFDGHIRAARIEDLPALQPILERWIFDRETGNPLPDEVADVMQGIRFSIEGTLDRTYVVAEDAEGRVVGMMGLVPPSAEMLKFTTSSNPAELINADVADDQRGKGVGKALVNHLEDVAVSKSYDGIVVNSGPRYRETGWPFWTRIYGEPVGTAKDLYGPGGDAMVWGKSLIASK
ncbi:MAG TPA: GNAT family N-acetyltransferase [Candidatus Saccharimonadales bacterium]|nr:GNAT family N-acetyltransferase [Candidatus Saccharimonadales bacterium]